MLSLSTVCAPSRLIRLALLLVLFYPTSSYTLPVSTSSNDLVAHEVVNTAGESYGGGNTTVLVARDAEQAPKYAELGEKIRAEMLDQKDAGVGGISKRADRQPQPGPYGEGAGGSGGAGVGGSDGAGGGAGPDAPSNLVSGSSAVGTGYTPPTALPPVRQGGRTLPQLLQHGSSMESVMRKAIPGHPAPFQFQQSPFNQYTDLALNGWVSKADAHGTFGQPFDARTGLFPIASGLQHIGIPLPPQGSPIYIHEQSQPFQLNGQQHGATNVKYHNMYDIQNGVIYSICDISTQEVNNFDWQASLPLQQWSDVAFLQWEQLGGELGGLVHVVFVQCRDPEVEMAITRGFLHGDSHVSALGLANVLPNGREAKRWLSSSNSMDTIKRILGSPIGERMALLLAQHKVVGRVERRVDTIWAFKDDGLAPKGATVVFKVVTARPGSRAGTKRPSGDDAGPSKQPPPPPPPPSSSPGGGGSKGKQPAYLTAGQGSGTLA
ncbi:hypothetical protein LTR86_003646 [Recurvomyces mirabilis]|nr:hypothetical protein LTR86_003646 [Recurvomyces mirabilis]